MIRERLLLFIPLLCAVALAGAPERLDSELGEMIGHYSQDRTNLTRYYSSEGPGGRGPGGGAGGRPAGADEGSAARRARFNKLYPEWMKRLEAVDFDALGQSGKVDYVLFKNHLARELRRIELDSVAASEVEPLVPFAPAITELEESRRALKFTDGKTSAVLLTKLAREVAEAQKSFDGPKKEVAAKVKRHVANRAVSQVERLRAALRNWFNFYNGYDPVFTWWVEEPYKALDKALQGYSSFLTDRFGGRRSGDRTTIIGNPIGRDALLAELAFEMIPYTPDELVALANKEYAWCEAEMKKAARELGFDDWHKALEHVKTLHVEPGKQPELIRRLAVEAIEFLEKHDLVTIPPLARETFRMEMMTPERQLMNPFFTGGEVISVSFPTSAMTHEQKLMSMRGNNIHFSHATVFHELIPGHHLQGFMAQRYRPYRGVFSTPFLGEGWALYWEMLLWDMGFHATPEDRIGALFWRMHRCARIIFSLNFHLEKMTAEECVNLLVERVGHERDNATAEVRRSFDGSYSPLYQAAYMLGGLQIRALHKELVGAGKMRNREFHDAVLLENRIPIEMIRASLTRQKLSRDFKSVWKFYGEIAAPAR